MNTRSQQIIAIIISLTILITLVFFSIKIPCPTNFQSYLFRTLLGFSVGSICFLIGGTISVNHKKISATGGAAFFVIIFFCTPKFFNWNNKCDEALMITIYLKDSSGNNPFDQDDSLGLILSNSVTKKPIDENGSCTFTDIPTTYYNNLISFRLCAKGWLFTNNMNLINDTLCYGSKTFLVQRDSSLCCIKGYIKDEQGNPIQGVNVSTEGISTTSDRTGWFFIHIPNNEQKSKYVTFITADKYEAKQTIIYPTLDNPVIVLKKR